MLYQKYVPYNEEMEKREDVCDYFHEKDGKQKEFDDGEEDVMYDVYFLICETKYFNYVYQTILFNISTSSLLS